MPDDVAIRLGLKGQQQTSRGLKQIASDERSVGTSAEQAGAKVRRLGADLSGVAGKGIGMIGRQARYGAVALGALALAGTKWGLAQNAQIEQARLRFTLFTQDVDGLTNRIKVLDKNSAFAFGDLADAAAQLGGSGIKDVPGVLQAAANAAAGGGKGTAGLQAIVLALSQIQSKGRLSQEEVNQLTEGGAITAQQDLAKGLHLTQKQLQNLGGEGIEAAKAIDVLTKAWTSGPMGDIAQRQTKTLTGQWNLFTGNLQTAAGAATNSLAGALRDDVLPAANHALDGITKLFGDEGLSNEEKLRRARTIIRRELGPIADDLSHKLDEADIPGHLGQIMRAAAPKLASAAGEIAPEVASAFVKAWLSSGPWIQLAGLLFLTKKTVDAARWLRGPKGKGGGALGDLAKGAKPIPVYVVNWGGKMPGGGAPPVPGGPIDKTPGWARTAKSVGRFAGPVGATIIIAEGLNVVLPESVKRAINKDLPSRAGGASVRRQAERQIPAPGFGGSMPGMPPVQVKSDVTVMMDGRETGRAIAVANARSKARK